MPKADDASPRPRKRKPRTPILVRPVRVEVGTRLRKNKTGEGTGRRQRMAIVTALYHAGFTYEQITKQTGLTKSAIRADLAKAESQFQLSTRLTNSLMRLDSEAVPLAIDHLIDALDQPDAKDGDLARRDTAMYKTLEGRGAFRNFASEKGGNGGSSAVSLQVQFSAPPGMIVPTQQAQIVGVARAVQEPSPAEVLSFAGSRESGIDAGGRAPLGPRESRTGTAAGAGVPEDFTD